MAFLYQCGILICGVLIPVWGSYNYNCGVLISVCGSYTSVGFLYQYGVLIIITVGFLYQCGVLVSEWGSYISVGFFYVGFLYQCGVLILVWRSPLKVLIGVNLVQLAQSFDHVTWSSSVVSYSAVCKDIIM